MEKYISDSVVNSFNSSANFLCKANDAMRDSITSFMKEQYEKTGADNIKFTRIIDEEDNVMGLGYDNNDESAYAVEYYDEDPFSLTSLQEIGADALYEIIMAILDEAYEVCDKDGNVLK